MKKPLISAHIIGLVLLTLSLNLPAATPASDLRAGDGYFAKFDDVDALAEYERAAQLDPKNFEALWKAAMTCINVGDRVGRDAKGDETTKLRYFKRAEDYALSALEMKPDDSRAHFLYAAALARRVSSFGRKEQIAAAYKIKDEIDRAIALDPGNDLAWHALAFWHRTLAEISGAARFLGGLFFGQIPKGSFEEAVKDFQKAIVLNPNYCNHHIELAQTYLDLKRKDLAANEYSIAISCPETTSQCAHFKEKARRALESLVSSGAVSGSTVAASAAQSLGR
jgi:tetratricopeptide (TPR) repeat protein